jgi:hypothetical protein
MLTYFLSKDNERGQNKKRFNWDLILSSKGMTIGNLIKLEEFVSSCLRDK